MGSETSSVKLPGFGKPINIRDTLKYDNWNETEKFPIAILDEGYEAPVLPTREYTIIELVNTITDKPDWQRKVFDDAIVTRWRAEALAQNTLADTFKIKPETQSAEVVEGSIDTDRNVEDDRSEAGRSDSTSSLWPASHGRVDVSPRMVDWAIAEVKYKAGIFEHISCIEALDGVWKSDTFVDEKLRGALELAVRPLEDVPEEEKDWHPGSENRVLDLVHPSIYPLVYGQSTILADKTCGVHDCISWIGQGQPLETPPDSVDLGPEWSKRFQWLPAEFEALPNSEDIIVKSYINNLHPKYHSDLYSVISKVVAKAVPLWNRVLSCISRPIVPPRVSDWSHTYMGYREDPDDVPDQDSSEDDDAYDDRLEEWKDKQEVIEPEPGVFKTTAERLRSLPSIRELDRAHPSDTDPYVDLRNDYGRLQIIVKLANIHLTPEQPEYPGGSWHVEGQANESICASAIYYYSSSNVTDSYLSFRQQVEDGRDLPYPHNEHKAVQQIYGFENGDPTIQNLGRVLTRESRLLCFPNVMHHRVSPFRLTDPSKPGHRKILALFLVDPHLKIISTENVPPQQHAWWREKVRDGGVFEKLPPELAENVVDSTEFPVTLEKAREQRGELMAQRKAFVKWHTEDFANMTTFSLCEH